MGGSGDGWIHGSSLGSHLGMPEHPDWNRGFVKGVCVCVSSLCRESAFLMRLG